jgi:hypothetical protein
MVVSLPAPVGLRSTGSAVVVRTVHVGSTRDQWDNHATAIAAPGTNTGKKCKATIHVGVQWLTYDNSKRPSGR